MSQPPQIMFGPTTGDTTACKGRSCISEETTALPIPNCVVGGYTGLWDGPIRFRIVPDASTVTSPVYPFQFTVTSPVYPFQFTCTSQIPDDAVSLYYHTTFTPTPCTAITLDWHTPLILRKSSIYTIQSKPHVYAAIALR